MPELPEVQTVVSDLKKCLTGYRIKGVEVLSGYKVNPDIGPFLQILDNSVFEDVLRIGKNIVVQLDNGNYLTFHLAMTGRILLRRENAPKDPHQKVQITLTKGNKTYLLRFCDMRMFGKAGVLDEKNLQTLRRKYGPDMYEEEILAEAFVERLQIRNTAVKNALLEQSVVAGLGNIYATDALWMAGIHPETRTSSINLERAKSLLDSAKTIIKEGVLHRGSTLPDEAYVDIFGKAGEHQNHFRIYGKTLCPKCNIKVEYKKVNGRGTYFCPVCQK